MSRWKVNITARAELELRRLIKSGKVTPDDLHVLKRWLNDMEEFGPAHIQSSPEWHDHELHREWLGYRSSAFSSSGRVIYRILHTVVIVEVHRVTTDHNYKRTRR